MSETWKSVVGFETQYEVSSRGRIRSIGPKLSPRWGNLLRGQFRIIAQRLDTRGYLVVNMTKADGRHYTRSVARLVLLAFRKRKRGKNYSNHKDRNKRNNQLTNLEWTDHPGNMKHAAKNGGVHPGSLHGNSKLTERIVLRIRQLRGVMFQREIAALFGVTQSCISMILRRVQWRHI